MFLSHVPKDVTPMVDEKKFPVNTGADISYLKPEEQKKLADSIRREDIFKYCVEILAGQEFERKTLIERIYQDMAGLGVLTDYLHDPNEEEISINSYNVIEISYPDHIKYLYDADAFTTPAAALDIV